MRRRPASSKRVRRASRFWVTRSGRITIGRMAIGIWGQARPRRRWRASRKRWGTFWRSWALPLRRAPHGSFDALPTTVRCMAFLFRLPCLAAAREPLPAAPDRCERATRKHPCGPFRGLSQRLWRLARTRRGQVLAVALGGSRQRLSDVTVWGELLRVSLSENRSEVPS